MNDGLDQLLHEHGHRWAASQPTPSLEDALDHATTRKHIRTGIAISATVVAVAAIAAIPLVQALTGGTPHRVGTSGMPAASVSASIAPSQLAPPAASVLPELAVLARSAATANADPKATGEAVRTTYRQAERVVLTGDTGTSPPGDTQVWVIQIHGAFTCVTCSRPPGATTPTGAAIALIINASTYQAYDVTITDKPHDLSSLGKVYRLAF